MTFIGKMAARTITLLLIFSCNLSQAAENWYPSRYGAEDTLGVINNLSPAKVLLAAGGVSEFLLVLGQPRFVGAVQAVINPVAIR